MTIKSILALTLWAGISLAQKPSSEITEGFKKLAPTAKINSANKTPIKGISQINLESASIDDVYYMTDDGKYLINGSIIETASHKNLTENSKSSKRKEIIGVFDKDNRIDFFPKDMKYHVTVFTDIDCGYCRKLHSQMKQLNNLGIGVSYLFYPRSGIGSESYKKAVTAWCAVDRNEAMTQSQNGIELESKQCNNPVKQHYASGNKVGVRGTPNIVTDSGILIPTYMPPEALLQKLNQLAAQ
jgi:thiol:disulfide interchange protein DsbC